MVTPLQYVEYEKYTQHNKHVLWDMEIKEVTNMYVQIKVVINRVDNEDEFEDVLQGLVDITVRKVYLRELPRAEIIISLYDEYTNDISSIPYAFMDVYMENGNVIIKKRDDKLQEIHLFPSLSVVEHVDEPTS